MIEVKMTFNNAAEVAAFFARDGVTVPARLGAVADVAAQGGIAAQEVKKGPGRPPKKVDAATVMERSEPAAKPAAVAKPAAPVAPVEDTGEPEPLETTFEDYKTFMTGAFTGGNRGIVLEVLAEYGVTKISGVPADKWNEVMGQVTSRIEAAALA